jgi:DNA modification methylase
MSKQNKSHSTRPKVVKIDPNVFSALAEAAMDRKMVSGWTHNFYRYPARFSPRFAATAIKCFSHPSDLVLDPYMGGGTAIIEGIAAGRQMVGNDLNSLASFITRVKTTFLSSIELSGIRKWAAHNIPRFAYQQPKEELIGVIDPRKTTNLGLVRARFIKKAVAVALTSIDELPTENAQNFAKCLILRVSQWALDGRERHTSLIGFRQKLTATVEEMLQSIDRFGQSARRNGARATILNIDACKLDQASVFQDKRQRAGLVITSPPYPGVHVLYHRWQVDGRRETPAPYWIAGCNDGQGASFYNFGDRRETAADKYFQTSLLTLQAIRRVMEDGGYMVQMLAFNRPEDQLPRYLENMAKAQFAEVRVGNHGRIWRQVPHRKWHAALTGKTHSSNEVVLVHRAI